MKKRVVIIGAGIGGIATASILAKAGFEVEVYEKNDTLGGRAGQLKLNGFKFDTGPSWYLMPSVFEHYFKLLGEDINKHLKLRKLDPAYKVFYEDGSNLLITSNIKKDAATFEAIEKGSGKFLKRYVDRGSKIYQSSLDHFLYTNFDSPRDFLKTDVIKDSTKMLKLALTPLDRFVNKFVTDLKLKQILEYPMVFLGASPFKAPAIYSLMSALDFKEGVFYPEGGMYTIIESMIRISEMLGVKYHLGTETELIIIKEGLAKGIKLKSGKVIKADIVISNADIYHTESSLIVEEKYRTYNNHYWDKKSASPSALLIYIGVEGKIKEFEHHNLFFVDKWQKNFDDIYMGDEAPDKASIYIGMTSKSDPTVCPDNSENIFVLVPLPAGIEMNDSEVREIAKHYLGQIKEMSGVDLYKRKKNITYFGPNDFATKFYSWKSSMLGPSHILKQSAIFRTKNVSRKVRNLYYVGAGTTPGIGLPMCLISAELVYKRIAGDKIGGKVKSIDSKLGIK